MHILPKNYGEFRSKDYWNKFFQQLKATSSEYFEWYGEYTDFKPMLFRLLGDIYTINNKLKDITVFHVGCGKSKFAENILKGLPMFGLHFVNCDYSEQIIDEMKNRSLEQNLPQHKIDYQVVDLLKELPEEFMNRFHVVLDKGTLDALLPEQQHDTIDTVKQVYFENI